MKKENVSLHWTVALYLALSTICVTVNRLCAECIERFPEMVTMESHELCEIIAYRQCSAANINKTLLPTSPALVRSNPIAVVSGKTDYKLSFDIVPTGTDSNAPSSILHFTTGTDCCDFGSRSPAIWFYRSSTNLHVRIGDSTNGNWGIDPPDVLPLNISTKVTLECRGNDVKLTLGTRAYTATQPTYRFAGNLIVFASDPWFPTAKAVISNLHYEILPAAGGNVVTIPLMNIQAVSVINPDNTLRQLEISWIPVGDNVTIYTVRVVGAGGSVGQVCTVCTTSSCLYVHQVTHVAVYYNISVTSINPDGTLGPQNSTTFSSTNSIFQNISFLSYSNSIDCSFLNNQSFYCVVSCSSDQSVAPDSSVYNLSTTKGTEVIVSLQNLTSGQMYYCKAAATNTNSTRCAGPVVGGVKMYFSFVASLPPTTFPTTSNLASIDVYYIIGITISISFVVFFSLGVLVTTCIGCMVKTRSKVTLHRPDPALESSIYEMIETDQNKIKAIELEVNSAYGTAK